MPRCLRVYKFVFVLYFLATPCLAEQFLVGTEDVPLMDGMIYSKDETFSFDNEDGRLYFSKTFIHENPQKIEDFYTSTLPQLGWTKNKDDTFEREGDILRIAIADESYHIDKKTTVIFELITKSK